MSYQTLLTDLEVGVLTVTLNRPDRLNAFTMQMMLDWLALADAIDSDDAVRAVVVTGAGRGFCAGADLGSGGDTFDADSRSSVLAKIEELVLGTMRGLITPEVDDSPIGRLRKELVDTVQREVSDVAEEVRRVTEHLGILDATEEVYEQTTGKGFDFEDLVDECVSTLAASHGDLAETTTNDEAQHDPQAAREDATAATRSRHAAPARGRWRPLPRKAHRGRDGNRHRAHRVRRP